VLAADALVLAGCAPDARRPDPGFDAFLGELECACDRQRICAAPVEQRFTRPGRREGGHIIDERSLLRAGRTCSTVCRRGEARRARSRSVRG